MATDTLLCIAATRRLRDITLQVDLAFGPGVTALVGPSGAGKSTLLRLIAGLARPDEGTVRLGEVLLDDAARGYHLAPGRRGISLVFQDYALFPHLSVAENVAYGLRARRVGGAERRDAGAPGHRRAGGGASGTALGRPAPARGPGPRPGAGAVRLAAG